MDLTGRVAVVTGANSGVGRSATELLRAAGAEVTLVCRDRTRGGRALSEIEGSRPDAAATLELADLSCPDSVRGLASRLTEQLARIDILVNNAGLALDRLQTTAEGFELTFATCHLGHFLLTNLLLDRLRGGGRIVNVSSTAHRFGDLRRAPLDRIARGRAWQGGFPAYCDAKLANVLFTAECARRWSGHGIAANAVHPGVLATNIWNRSQGVMALLMRAITVFMRRADVGGTAVVELIRRSEPGRVSGRYFHVRAERPPQPQAADPDLAHDLWERSLVWTGLG
ncbi:MAG: SDR family NAD(P)-dependent oxidoreductase [Spirochaetaceae bacterium]|nr:SDR family NAD(P)-dependent oxidoreductase [Spirochaetaceae bacterium]